MEGADPVQQGAREIEDKESRTNVGCGRAEKEEKTTNRYHGILLYYAIWWKGKTAQQKVGRKFWQKPYLLYY
jgi:hypothetical protein